MFNLSHYFLLVGGLRVDKYTYLIPGVQLSHRSVQVNMYFVIWRDQNKFENIQISQFTLACQIAKNFWTLSRLNVVITTRSRCAIETWGGTERQAHLYRYAKFQVDTAHLFSEFPQILTITRWDAWCDNKCPGGDQMTLPLRKE